MRKGLIFLLFSLLAVSRVRAEDLIQAGETVSLSKALEIAAKTHPSIIVSEQNLKASQARVYQVGSNFWPQVNANGSYTRYSPIVQESKTPSGLSGLGISTGPKKGEQFDNWSASITLQQLLFDFGKTYHQTGIQSLYRDSSKFQLENVSQQVFFGVKQAYYGVLLSRRNREVAEEGVKQFEQHLTQARGFYEVGAKPKFDVTRAEVDLSNSQLGLINAENSLKVAKVTLNNAMGLPGAPEYNIEDILAYLKYEITLEQGLERADRNRPDLLSVQSQQKAAAKAVSLAWTGYAPLLTANADYKWNGEDFPLEDGWDVGAAVVVPLFNGFLTKSQVDEAKANLYAANANLELTRQGILLEIQQAYLNLKAAEDGIPTAQLVVKQAQENLELANGRYAAGVGSPIEVTDAEVAYLNARLSETQSLYNYKIAQAGLEKAMGER